MRIALNREPQAGQDACDLPIDTLLPPEWTAEFHQAAIQADADHALELIEQIREGREPLADALANLVNNFRFDTLMDLTQP